VQVNDGDEILCQLLERLNVSNECLVRRRVINGWDLSTSVWRRQLQNICVHQNQTPETQTEISCVILNSGSAAGGPSHKMTCHNAMLQIVHVGSVRVDAQHITHTFCWPEYGHHLEVMILFLSGRDSKDTRR
jgi:hypothetical protein